MRIKALKAAFPATIPIFTGFWFLGMAYGIYMNASGFSFVYPLCMSLLIYGGSLEFVAVEMLLSPFAPLQTFIMALLIQARHLFYGLSMLDKFKGMGWKKYYLIFGMCDETFSVNCSADIPEDVDRGWFYFWVSSCYHWRYCRISVKNRYLRHQFCHDRHVRSHLSGTMVKRKRAQRFSDRAGCLCPVPGHLWPGFLHDSSYGTDCRPAGIASQTT